MDRLESLQIRIKGRKYQKRITRLESLKQKEQTVLDLIESLTTKDDLKIRATRNLFIRKYAKGYIGKFIKDLDRLLYLYSNKK